MSKDYWNTAVCPHCTDEIATVTVAKLQTAHSQTVVKFWTCPRCETIIGPTRNQELDDDQ